MRAALVLLLAVGISSKPQIPTNDTSQDVPVSYTSQVVGSDQDVPIISAMMGNMQDILDDMLNIQKEMVQQNCPKSNEIGMKEEDPGHDMDGISPRIICHNLLTTRFQDCRTMCNALPTMMGRITCRNDNWWSYLNKCFGGFRYLDCPASVTIITPPTTTSTPIASTTSNYIRPGDMTSLNLVSRAPFTFTGSYFFTTNKMTRSAGKTFCEMNNGILAEPLLTDLKNIIGALNSIIGVTKTRGYWLGAKRDGTFRWENSGNRIPETAAQWFKKPDSGVLCPVTNCQSDCAYITPETSVPVDSHLNAFLSCSSTLYPLCQTL